MPKSCNITVLCLLLEPSYKLTSCFSLSLSHAPEYMSLIRFIKFGDKIRVQCTRIKKWLIVVSKIRLHKSKQKPVVISCPEGIVPRIGEDRL